MTTHVERSIEVDVPVRTAYDQWTQFEDFPHFMGGVQQVRQVGNALTHWVAEIAGVRREWDAEILEQVPDQKVAWAATSGATNAGTVYFDAVGADRTRVRLTLDYEPEGILEKIGDVLDVVERQAVADLDRFKQFIESRGSATGGWRGAVDDPGAPPVGADAAAAGGVAASEVAQAGVQGDSGAGVGNAGRAEAGVPGDIVAVGPSGSTESTLDTEPGPARSGAAVADDDALGHSGDPVAVDPDAVGSAGVERGGAHVVGSQTTGSAGTSGPTADAASSSEAGVTGFGTDTGMSSSPTSGVLTGNPGSATADQATTGSDAAERTGATAGAATSSEAGVTGFGTDTGMSSSPTSGVLTGDPGGRTASHAGTRTGQAASGAWADDAGSRSATTGTDEPWAPGGSGPGEDRGRVSTAGEGVVQRDFADENLTTEDVVARDFDDRDISGEGTVERDFANRDITERDIANRGIVHQGGGDDPDNPTRPSV